MKITISLQESGTSGFIVRDTTDISNIAGKGFLPETAPLNQSNLRTKDSAFLDFVTYNALAGEKVEFFTYLIGTDKKYREYTLDYDCIDDGWYILNHLVLPTYEWFMSIEKLAIANGVYYLYNESTESISKAIKTNSGVSFEHKVDPMTVYYLLGTETLEGVLESIFMVGNLEKCYETKVKDILYSKLYTKCGVQDRVFRDRDFSWMTLELVRYLVRYCKFHEALRILESTGGCNGFCNTSNITDRQGKITNCNCVR